MMRGQFTAVVLGVIATVIVGASGFAAAQETSVKQKMSENFAGMQIVLTSLMTSNYAAAPDQIAIIADHATYLMHSVPDSAKEYREQFIGYAYGLQGHARDLSSIIELLIKQDEANGKVLETNDLREAAAAHYGGMVTTCVACHNHFRRHAIQ
jgi:hypothetical protein